MNGISTGESAVTLNARQIANYQSSVIAMLEYRIPTLRMNFDVISIDCDLSYINRMRHI